MPTPEALDRSRVNREIEQYQKFIGVNPQYVETTRSFHAIIALNEAQVSLEETLTFLQERPDLACGDHQDIDIRCGTILHLATKILEHLSVCESSRQFLRPQLTLKNKGESSLCAPVSQTYQLPDGRIWEDGAHGIPASAREEKRSTFREVLEAYTNIYPAIPLEAYGSDAIRARLPLLVDGVLHFRFRHLHLWLRKTKRSVYMTQQEFSQLLTTNRYESALITIRVEHKYNQLNFWHKK